MTDEYDREYGDREREHGGRWDDAEESDRPERRQESAGQDPWAQRSETDDPDSWDESAGANEPGESGVSGETREADESDGGGRRRRAASRAAAEPSTAWSSPAEPEDELRSFVESEALPSEERMAAAELEAEHEAERDAAERRAHTDEVAGAEGAAAAAAPRRRAANGRSVDGRLARLHLKGGLVALARAELETMAGQVSLDLEALADLAEARWRSGDLLGAGEAAQAHLARGGEELIAMVVAVEALTAQGRTIDARRLAAQVLDRTDGELDPVFTGQPRAQLWSRPAETAAIEEPPAIEVPAPAPERRERAEPATPVWPDESRVTPLENIPPEELQAARVPTESGVTVWPEQDRAERTLEEREAEAAGEAEPAAAAGGGEFAEPEHVAEPAPRGARSSPEVTARRELSGIESALRQGRLEPVTGRLALLLRTEPDLADRVAELSLAAIALTGGADAEAANLYIVRGDALRVLGRSEEADLAYEQSRRALGPELAEEERPELFSEVEEPGLPAIGLAEPAGSLEPAFADGDEVLTGEGEYAGDVPIAGDAPASDEVSIAEAGEDAVQDQDEGWAPGAEGYAAPTDAEPANEKGPDQGALTAEEPSVEAAAEVAAPEAPEAPEAPAETPEPSGEAPESSPGAPESPASDDGEASGDTKDEG